MPSIKIREIDTTSPGALENITNVVYVPGFINPSYINSDGTSTCGVIVIKGKSARKTCPWLV